MVDSDAPEQIADELGRRHAHYLREAQRLVLEGEVPDETGLADGIRAETARYLRLAAWLGHADPRAGCRRCRGARARVAARDRRDGRAAAPTPPRHRRPRPSAPRARALRDDRRQHGRPQAAHRARAWSCRGTRRRQGRSSGRFAISSRPDPRQRLRRGRELRPARPAPPRSRSSSTSTRGGSS